MNASEDAMRVVTFYEGSAPDDRGRFLDDVLHFNDTELEQYHDYIQWLFPTLQGSAYNPTAPILNASAVDVFHERHDLQTALRRSLSRMLTFYSLEWAQGSIVRATSFAMHRSWLTLENHNHLRLTRILTSLRLLGDDYAAQALFRCLTEIEADERSNGANGISQSTLKFWTEAAQTAPMR